MGNRVCLDQRDLKQGLKRCYDPMTTIEDILTELNETNMFSVFDANNGFWHLELEEESSYLTTFNIPHCRYRRLRMPVGQSTAQKEFQETKPSRRGFAGNEVSSRLYIGV